MKNKFKKLLSLLMIVSLVLGAVPMGAFAGTDLDELSYESMHLSAVVNENYNVGSEIGTNEQCSIEGPIVAGGDSICSFINIQLESDEDFNDIVLTFRTPEESESTTSKIVIRTGNLPNNYTDFINLQPIAVSNWGELLQGRKYSLTIEGEALEAVKEHGNRLFITTDEDKELDIAVSSINTTVITSDDNTVKPATSGQLTINDNDGTIVSGTTELNTDMTVDMFLALLSKQEDAEWNVFNKDADVTNFSDFRNTSCLNMDEKISNNVKLIVMSESEMLKIYTLSVVDAAPTPSAVNTVTTVEPNTLDINNPNSTIGSQMVNLTTDTTVSQFMNLLAKDANASWKLVSEITMVMDAEQFKSATAKLSTDKLAPRDKLVVLAENGSLKIYTLEVTERKPLSSDTTIVPNTIGFKVEGTNLMVTADLITDPLTVPQLLGILNKAEGTVLKYVTAAVANTITDEDSYDSAATVDNETYIAIGDYVAVKAPSGAIAKYLLVAPKSSDNKVTSSMLSVNSDANTIQSGTAILATSRMIGAVKSMLLFPDASTNKFVTADTTIVTAADFDAATTKASSAWLASGDKLAVKAENGDVRVYTIYIGTISSNTSITPNTIGFKVEDTNLLVDPNLVTEPFTVQELYNILNRYEGTVLKYVTAAVAANITNATSYDSATAVSSTTNIAMGDYVVAKAPSGAIAKYLLVAPKSSNNKVTATVLNVDSERNLIRSGTTTITNLTSVSDFFNMLTLPPASSAKVTAANKTITNAADFDAVLFKAPDASLDHADKLAVKAENGDVRVYTLQCVCISTNTALTTNTKGFKVEGTNIMVTADLAQTPYTVQKLLSILIRYEGTDTKYVTAAVANTITNASSYDNAATVSKENNITMGDYVVAKAPSGAIAKYLLVGPAQSNNNTVTSSNLSVNSDTNIIQSGIYPLTNEITVFGLLNMITLPSDASCKVVTADKTVANEADFSAVQEKSTRDSLANGDKLAVKAQNGDIRVYTILLMAEPPAPTVVSVAKSALRMVSTNSATFQIEANCNGIIYSKFQLDSANAPSIESMMTPSNQHYVTSGAPINITFNTLQSSTNYKLYLFAVDEQNNRSEVSVIPARTTTAPVTPVVPPVVPPVTPTEKEESRPSNSGSSAPSVVPVAKPANNKIEVIVNGIKEAIAEAKDTTVGGIAITTVTVDPSAMKEKVDRERTKLSADSAKKLEVELLIPSSSSSVKKAALNLEDLKTLSGANATLKVVTQLGSYDLTASVINKQKTEAPNSTLNIVVAEVDKAKATAIEAALASQSTSLVPVGQYIDFALNAVSADGKETAVSHFEEFVSRTLPAPYKTITTGLVLGANDVWYTVPTVVMNNNTVAASGKINSLSNSVYTLVANTKVFTDIKGTKYEAAIQNMGNRLVIEGSADGTFKPEGKVTRAEFATMLTKALGLYRGEMGKTSFKDMSSVEGLNVGISVAADNNIIKGNGNATLKPNATITSEEMATMISMILSKYKTGELTKTNTPVTVSNWASAYITDVTALGIIQDFKLGKEMTRAEASYAIEQMLKALKLID